MKNFVLALFSLFALSNHVAHANSFNTSVRCFNGSCVLRACLNGECLKFTGGKSGRFMQEGSILRVEFNNKTPPFRYFSWDDRKWLSGQALERVCYDCAVLERAENKLATSSKKKSKKKISVDGSISVGPQGIRSQVNVGVSGQRKVTIDTIERVCYQSFTFMDETQECRDLIVTNPSPEWALAILETLGNEKFHKMELLKLALSRYLEVDYVRACMRSSDFYFTQVDCFNGIN